MPALRERREDIPEILKKILKREHEENNGMTMDPDAVKVLMNHPFPGNVRELETYVHRLQLINGPDSKITMDKIKDVLEPVEDVPESKLKKEDVEDSSLKHDIELIEKNRIQKALEENNFNITISAEDLGISRQGLHNKIKRYKLSKR